MNMHENFTRHCHHKHFPQNVPNVVWRSPNSLAVMGKEREGKGKRRKVEGAKGRAWRTFP